MTRHLPGARSLSLLLLLGLSAPSIGCTDGGSSLEGISSFQVAITKVNGADPPPLGTPLPANIGDVDETWDFEATAVDAHGQPVDFDGFARVRVTPGAVDGIHQEGAVGRNILFAQGKAQGSVLVTAVYGPTRLWIEDAGFAPVDPNKPPSCADCKDTNGDGVIDYPADPG